MSDDLIKKSDAIKTLTENVMFEFTEDEEWAITCLQNLPSADRPQNVIAEITFDEEKLREIVKEAVERFKEEYEIVDRPQGEWIYTNNPLRLDDEWACNRCGNISFVKTNFCDRCGARMKGADDD